MISERAEFIREPANQKRIEAMMAATFKIEDGVIRMRDRQMMREVTLILVDALMAIDRL